MPTIRFDDLGAPMQAFIQQLNQGCGLSETEMAMLVQFISVRDMARVFEQMSAGVEAQEIWQQLSGQLEARREKEAARRRAREEAEQRALAEEEAVRRRGEEEEERGARRETACQARQALAQLEADHAAAAQAAAPAAGEGPEAEGVAPHTPGENDRTDGTAVVKEVEEEEDKVEVDDTAADAEEQPCTRDLHLHPPACIKEVTPVLLSQLSDAEGSLDCDAPPSLSPPDTPSRSLEPLDDSSSHGCELSPSSTLDSPAAVLDSPINSPSSQSQLAEILIPELRTSQYTKLFKKCHEMEKALQQLKAQSGGQGKAAQRQFAAYIKQRRKLHKEEAAILRRAIHAARPGHGVTFFEPFSDP